LDIKEAIRMWRTALFVTVFIISFLFLEDLLSLRFMLGLASEASFGRRVHFKPRFGYFALTINTDAVKALVDSVDGVLNGGYFFFKCIE